MKKVTLLFMSCLLLLMGGCSSKEASTGKVLDIGVDDAITKIEKEQTFVLLVTRSKCTYCEALLEVLKNTISEHDTVIYNAVMDDSTLESFDKDKEKLEKYVKDPTKTPHYYYIKGGEVIDSEMGFSEALPDRFWEWIDRNEIEDLK